MRKGQVALEFIFIVLIVIVYLFTTTQPLIQNAQMVTTDIQKISMANNETQKLLNSITRVATFGIGSRETIQIFLPSDSNSSAQIMCYDKNIGFSVQLLSQPYPVQCSNGNCDKNFAAPEGITLDCQIEIIRGTQKIIIAKEVANKISIFPGS